VWFAELPLTVSFVPSPKFHKTLLIDADDGLGTAVNMIGEPAVATLDDVATDTDRGIGFVFR
jgi:hypothetical protein